MLFVDTFNRYFEPETIAAALTVLASAGYATHLPRPVDGSTRPLCCGRTFLAIGAVERAREEARRTIEALAPRPPAGSRCWVSSQAVSLVFVMKFPR